MMPPHGKGIAMHEPGPGHLNLINGPRSDEEGSAVIIPPGKDLNKLCGFTPSDIDNHISVILQPALIAALPALFLSHFYPVVSCLVSFLVSFLFW